MERKTIFFLKKDPLTLEEFINELNKLYISLNLNNKEYLENKYRIYLELFYKFKTNTINLTARFDMSLFGFKKIKNTRSIEFYIDMGYSFEDAKVKLSNKQNNYDIEKVKKRHGVDDIGAKIIIKGYIDKGINTFLGTHTKEEIDDINHRKGITRRPEYYLGKTNDLTGKEYTEDEAILEYKIKQSYYASLANKNKQRKDYNTTIEYWLHKCDGDIVLAYNLLKERQTTFTKEKCITRYGLEKGLDVYNNRQMLWRRKLDNKTESEKLNIELKKFRNNKKRFFSTESIFYFDIIIKILNDLTTNLTFLYKEKELMLKDKNKVYFYDFTIVELDIIIEYCGSHVHPSPILNEEEKKEWRHVFTKKGYEEVLEKDNFKQQIAVNNGYKIYKIFDYEKYEKLNFLIEEITNEFNKRRNAVRDPILLPKFL